MAIDRRSLAFAANLTERNRRESIRTSGKYEEVGSVAAARVSKRVVVC